MQIDQFQPSGASSPQVVWFAGTSHVSIRGLRGIVDVSSALGLVYVWTMRGTSVFCWMLDDGGEKKLVDLGGQKKSGWCFFQKKTNVEIQGALLHCFLWWLFLGGMQQKLNTNVMWGHYFRSQHFRSQYCKDPKMKELRGVQMFAYFPTLCRGGGGGKLWFPLVFNASVSQISTRPRRLVKDSSTWWWFSKGIWCPKMPNKNANFIAKTPPKFNSSPLKRDHFNTKGCSSNHHFSRAMFNFKGSQWFGCF